MQVKSKVTLSRKKILNIFIMLYGLNVCKSIVIIYLEIFLEFFNIKISVK